MMDRRDFLRTVCMCYGGLATFGFPVVNLRATLDTRAVLKGAIAGTFDLTAAQADRVFPGSEGVRGLYEMLR